MSGYRELALFVDISCDVGSLVSALPSLGSLVHADCPCGCQSCWIAVMFCLAMDLVTKLADNVGLSTFDAGLGP